MVETEFFLRKAFITHGMAGLRTLNRNARKINRVNVTCRNVIIRLKSIQMHIAVVHYSSAPSAGSTFGGFWLYNRVPSIRFKVTVQSKQQNKRHSWIWTPLFSRINLKLCFDPKKAICLIYTAPFSDFGFRNNIIHTCKYPWKMYMCIVSSARNYGERDA